MVKAKLISFVIILILAQVVRGQNKPNGIYLPQTIFYSIPKDDGHGFTSFKFKKGQKPRNDFVFIFYNDHILLKLGKYVNLKINKITEYSDDISYLVTDPQGRQFKIALSKNESDKDHIINYTTLDEKQHDVALIMIISVKTLKLPKEISNH